MGIILGLLFSVAMGPSSALAVPSRLLQLAEQLADKPKGSTTAFSLAKEISTLTPGSREEIEALLALIRTREGGIREDLIKSIANISDRRFAPFFLEKLKHPHHMVQAIAAGMCGRFKLRQAQEPLMRLIRRAPPIEQFPDSDQERAVVTAVLALGELGQDSSVEFLLSLLGSMKGYEVQALRKFGVRPLEGLLAILNDPQSSGEAKMAAVQVMMALEDPAALPILRRAAGDPQNKARPYAITTILKIDPEKSLFEFIARWREKPDPVLESRLLFYINHWRLGDGRLEPFLREVLQDSQRPGSRRMAVVSLARIKSRGARKALEQAAAGDADKTVRLYARQALQMSAGKSDQGVE